MIGSLFSGIGGFDLAAGRCGFPVAWQVELDAFARRILARHWPDTERHEDIRTVDPRKLAPITILCGGWPCQDLSVAGKRAGLQGERSGLFSEILRLIDGMDPRPPFLLLENVPGLVSSSAGRDFPAVVGELRRRGYVGCVRLLDAQHFGLAQRRRRLFFVCGLGAAGLRAVQLVLEGGQRYPAPQRKAREDAAYTACRSAQGSGVATSLTSHSQRWEPAAETYAVRVPLTAWSAENGGPGGTGICEDIMWTLNAAEEHAVAHSLSAAHRGSEDGTGRGTPLVITCDGCGGAFFGELNTLCPRCGGLHSGQATYPPERGGSAEGYAEAAAPLRAGRLIADTHGDAGNVVYGVSNDPTPKFAEDLATPIQAKAEGGGRMDAVLRASMVRRLTPTECERLQGFPDGWTCLCGRNDGRSYGSEPCTCPDGPRYRALGNAVAVPCIEWLMTRIAMTLT